MINKFSVPAKYNLEYIEKIDYLNNLYENKVTELYGSNIDSPVGSIRPSNTLENVSKDKFKEFVRYANKKNIKFNYIMNSTVLDGSEYTSKGIKDILKYVEFLENCGVNNLSITIPYLIKLINKHFPQLNITASICANINSIKQADDFKNMGATTIVPEKDTNRDFGLLKLLSDKRGYSIKLLCTTPCIYKCSDLNYHMNLSSTLDNKIRKGQKIADNFISHTVNCQAVRLRNLEEYIKSPFIRPEDLKIYQNIGINSFKLDGRDKPDEYNLEVMEAYLKESFDGNLLYLMQNYYPKNFQEFSDLKNTRKIEKLGVYIDNKKLNNFLTPFVEKKMCEKGCDLCLYCKKWSDEIVKIDKKNVDNYLVILENHIKSTMYTSGE